MLSLIIAVIFCLVCLRVLPPFFAVPIKIPDEKVKYYIITFIVAGLLGYLLIAYLQRRAKKLPEPTQTDEKSNFPQGLKKIMFPISNF